MKRVIRIVFLGLLGILVSCGSSESQGPITPDKEREKPGKPQPAKKPAGCDSQGYRRNLEDSFNELKAKVERSGKVNEFEVGVLSSESFEEWPEEVQNRIIENRFVQKELYFFLIDHSSLEDVINFVCE